jgi:hypothetical protein
MLREIGAEKLINTENYYFEGNFSPSQWSRGLRCGSAAVNLLGLRFRIPLSARMFVSCKCCVMRYLRRADHSFRGVLHYLYSYCDLLHCSMFWRNVGVNSLKCRYKNVETCRSCVKIGM